MPRVTKRPLAFADLAEIWSFIADDSEVSADRFLALMNSKFELLSTQPAMGRLRDELLPQLRSFPVGRYVVFYVAISDGVELVRILHSSRDTAAADFD